MHFRIRKNVVQLVRNTYDPANKRAVATVVARMPLAAPALTQEILSLLTPAETAEAKDWVDSQHRAATLHKELAALELPRTLELATQWFDQDDRGFLSANLAPQVVQAWQRLRIVMKRRGLID